MDKDIQDTEIRSFQDLERVVRTHPEQQEVPGQSPSNPPIDFTRRFRFSPKPIFRSFNPLSRMTNMTNRFARPLFSPSPFRSFLPSFLGGRIGGVGGGILRGGHAVRALLMIPHVRIAVIAIIVVLIFIVSVIAVGLGSSGTGIPGEAGGPGSGTGGGTITTAIPGLSLNVNGPTSVNNGEKIVYSISITYSGPLDVQIKDSIPSNASFVSATGTYTEEKDSSGKTVAVVWMLKENSSASGAYSFEITLQPASTDTTVVNTVSASARESLPVAGSCPSDEEIKNNKNPSTCTLLAGANAIDIFDTNFSDDMKNKYINTYAKEFVGKNIVSPPNGTIMGTQEEFVRRVNIIIDTSKTAGINPVLFLGYWKTETKFSTVYGADVGCDPTTPRSSFENEVRCGILRSQATRCAIRGECGTIQRIKTFNEYVYNYGSFAVDRNNCSHTYNMLIEVAKEMNACK